MRLYLQFKHLLFGSWTLSFTSYIIFLFQQWTSFGRINIQGYTELSLYLSMMAPSVNTDHYFSSNWSVKINLIMHEKAQAVLSIHFEFELTSIFPSYYFCQRWAVDFEIDKRTTWEKFLRFELRRIVAKLVKWS